MQTIRNLLGFTAYYPLQAIYEVPSISFQTFFRLGTFIDITLTKL